MYVEKLHFYTKVKDVDIQIIENSIYNINIVICTTQFDSTASFYNLCLFSF